MLMLLLLRLCIGALLLFGGFAAIDQLFGTDIIGAIGRMLAWFGKMITQFITRMAVSLKLVAPGAKNIGFKALMRKVIRPVWKFAFSIVLVHVFGHVRVTYIERRLSRTQKKIVERIRSWLNTTTNLPLPAQAAIALVVLSIFLWAFLWVNANRGALQGLFASLILWAIFVRVKVIGVDALTSLIVEKWAPVKRLTEKHRWITWLWFGPFWHWLAGKGEEMRGNHAAKNKGRSSWETRREKKIVAQGQRPDKNEAAE